MKPPGKTTLNRMQHTAFLEAERIEISQDARVRNGELKEPMPEQVERRDDFAGIVRLIDTIMTDATILERLRGLADGGGKPQKAPVRESAPIVDDEEGSPE